MQRRFPTERAAYVKLRGRTCSEGSLQATVRRSHDKRCASGSGLGRAISTRPKGRFETRGNAKAVLPLAGETSASDAIARVPAMGGT